MLCQIVVGIVGRLACYFFFYHSGGRLCIQLLDMAVFTVGLSYIFMTPIPSNRASVHKCSSILTCILMLNCPFVFVLVYIHLPVFVRVVFILQSRYALLGSGWRYVHYFFVAMCLILLGWTSIIYIRSQAALVGDTVISIYHAWPYLPVACHPDR